jgi:drug/metabolite transporter (DMT)-like permease
MTTRTATTIGFIAILLWSMLAMFTAATGTIPPFQLNAMCFLVGGLVGVGSWIVRPQGIKALKQKPVVWALGIGGLFGYHALYFAALRWAPPAESGLINYLWPLLIVLFSSLLPGEHLRRAHLVGALLGFAGVIVLIAGRGALNARTEYLPGYFCAFVAAFVWGAYSVLSRRFGQVPTDAVAGFCLMTSLLSWVCHFAFETTVWPENTMQWLAVLALGLGPVGAAFYVWDIGMKRGDIRLLGVAGYAEPTLTLALSCGLIVTGALVATLTPKRTARA